MAIVNNRSESSAGRSNSKPDAYLNVFVKDENGESFKVGYIALADSNATQKALIDNLDNLDQIQFEFDINKPRAHGPKLSFAKAK